MAFYTKVQLAFCTFLASPSKRKLDKKIMPSIPAEYFFIHVEIFDSLHLWMNMYSFHLEGFLVCVRSQCGR